MNSRIEQLASDYADRIEKLLIDKGIQAELEDYEYVDDQIVIDIYIEGDWKHDHEYADILVDKAFHPDEIDEINYDETDYNDFYGSAHIYRFNV